jgi:hypothetical protein
MIAFHVNLSPSRGIAESVSRASELDGDRQVML